MPGKAMVPHHAFSFSWDLFRFCRIRGHTPLSDVCLMSMETSVAGSALS